MTNPINPSAQPESETPPEVITAPPRSAADIEADIQRLRDELDLLSAKNGQTSVSRAAQPTQSTDESNEEERFEYENSNSNWDEWESFDSPSPEHFDDGGFNDEGSYEPQTRPASIAINIVIGVGLLGMILNRIFQWPNLIPLILVASLIILPIVMFIMTRRETKKQRERRIAREALEKKVKQENQIKEVMTQTMNRVISSKRHLKQTQKVSEVKRGS